MKIFGGIISISKGWKIYKKYPDRRSMTKDYNKLKGKCVISARKVGGLSSKYPYIIMIKSAKTQVKP